MIMKRTTWFLFANWNYKHHMDKKEKQLQIKGSERNTTQKSQKRQNNKQQTTSTYIICNNIQAKANNNTQNTKTLQTTNSAKWEFKTARQREEWYERRGCCLQLENTNIILTRRNHNDIQQLFNRGTTQNRSYKKQQLNTVYVITYKQRKTSRPNIQTIIKYEQVMVQSEKSNNITNMIMIRTT